MAATVPTTEPTNARAGDTWQWRREDLPDYPAGTWTLKYYFRKATSYFDITATADGLNFAVTVAKATSAAYPAGSYDWIAVVESVTERHEIDSGRMEIKPNLATAAAFDGRSFARTMLDAIEAALTSKASKSQLDLVRGALADRSLEYDTAALMTLRGQFRSEVKREESAQSGVASNRLLVRFG